MKAPKKTPDNALKNRYCRYNHQILKPIIMRQIILSMITFMTLSACHKSEATLPADQVVLTGILHEQGPTTYMYGTHTLNGRVLKSDRVNLNLYEGSKVMVTATNIHYTAELGPELYNVTAIVRVP